jgi:hypothetical protein
MRKLFFFVTGPTKFHGHYIKFNQNMVEVQSLHALRVNEQQSWDFRELLDTNKHVRCA